MSDNFSEAWIDGPQKTAFYTRTYEARGTVKAALIFIHGFIEHIARYEHALPLWAERGISVFAYDQRGFGRTATDLEHKSSSSSYGKTSWRDQMNDISFFILRERERLGPNVPLFLMGQSMGGGEVLGFATVPPTHTQALGQLSGILAASPLIRQTVPAPAWKKWIGGKLAALGPSIPIAAPIVAEDLTHDPVVNEAYEKDPLVRPFGTLRGIADMLSQGIALAETHHKNWPPNLPVLILHGTEDKVTSHLASQKFHDDLSVSDKRIILFEGAYHELANEPNGEGFKFVTKCIDWVEGHLNSPSMEAKL